MNFTDQRNTEFLGSQRMPESYGMWIEWWPKKATVSGSRIDQWPCCTFSGRTHYVSAWTFLGFTRMKKNFEVWTTFHCNVPGLELLENCSELVRKLLKFVLIESLQRF